MSLGAAIVKLTSGIMLLYWHNTKYLKTLILVSISGVINMNCYAAPPCVGVNTVGSFSSLYQGGITMNRVPVSSSNLRAIGYDPDSCTLEIEFLNGGLYRYSGVPVSVHASLMSASSHGSYFDANIKKGGYPYTKLR